jgi:hypothetical protein
MFTKERTYKAIDVIHTMDELRTQCKDLIGKGKMSPNVWQDHFSAMKRTAVDVLTKE